MCMSTTGFGSKGNSGNRASGLSRSGRPFNRERSLSQREEMSLHSTMTMQPPQSQTIAKRRQPVFDMDLRELFSDEETATRPLSRLDYYPHPPVQPQYQPNPNIQMKRESTSTSNPMSPPQYQGSGLQGPNAITTAALRSPTSATVPPPNLQDQQQNAFSLSNQAPYNNFTNQIQNQFPMMSPFSDLDFLETLPLGGDAGAGNAFGQPASGYADFDLGLGGGWDGSVPGQGWGDDGGTNLDLFDGFFSGWRNNSNGI